MTRAATAVRTASDALRAAGVPSPEADAAILVAHALGVPRSHLALADAPDPAALDQLVRRRVARQPLQHITGVAHFRHVSVRVGPGVFVPRPETELLIDHVLGLAAELAVDLCSGSGALALALADEVPGCRVHAVEADADAFYWLHHNINPMVTAHLTQVDGCLRELDGIVDVVVANPPYLLPDALLDRESASDPPVALFGTGPGGLDQVRSCIEAASRLLRPGGRLVIEHDLSQAGAVADLMGATFTDIVGHPDLTGRPRLTRGSRAGLTS